MIAEFEIEVIKLLIQIAWADREVASEERLQILELARTAELAEESIENLRLALADGNNLPAPNLEYLKQHRDEVRRAATALIRIDQRIMESEEAMLDAVNHLLSD